MGSKSRMQVTYGGGSSEELIEDCKKAYEKLEEKSKTKHWHGSIERKEADSVLSEMLYTKSRIQIIYRELKNLGWIVERGEEGGLFMLVKGN